jgi:hypothetical protein
MKDLKENININNLSKDKKKKFKLPKPSSPVHPLKRSDPSSEDKQTQSPLVVFEITISPTITFLKDRKIKDAAHLINSQITNKKSFFQVFDTHLLAYTINHLNDQTLSLDNVRQTEFFRAHKKLLLERGHILINDIQFSIVKARNR